MNKTYPPDHRCQDCKKLTKEGMRQNGRCRNCFYVFYGKSEKMKEYRKAYYHKRYVKLKADPIKLAEHRRKCREYQRKRYYKLKII